MSDLNVVIIRALPGSGKTEFAKLIAGEFGFICEADHYAVDDEGNYSFDPAKLGYCHGECMKRFKSLVDRKASTIVVSNTATTEKEFSPYKVYAEDNGYRVTIAVLENRHGNESVHDVPEDVMWQMKKRFQVKL